MKKDLMSASVVLSTGVSSGLEIILLEGVKKVQHSKWQQERSTAAEQPNDPRARIKLFPLGFSLCS